MLFCEKTVGVKQFFTMVVEQMSQISVFEMPFCIKTKKSKLLDRLSYCRLKL